MSLDFKSYLLSNTCMFTYVVVEFALLVCATQQYRLNYVYMLCTVEKKKTITRACTKSTLRINKKRTARSCEYANLIHVDMVDPCMLFFKLSLGRHSTCMHACPIYPIVPTGLPSLHPYLHGHLADPSSILYGSHPSHIKLSYMCILPGRTVYWRGPNLVS